MGCGCKGNKTQSNGSQTTTTTSTTSTTTNESLKDKIKKTVEKYYTANKTI